MRSSQNISGWTILFMITFLLISIPLLGWIGRFQDGRSVNTTNASLKTIRQNIPAGLFLALYTLRKECWKEVEPPHLLQFWHFPLLLHVGWPAQISIVYQKTQLQFNLTYPPAIYCETVLYLKIWQPTFMFEGKQSVWSGLYTSNWSTTTSGQTWLSTLSIKWPIQGSFSTGPRLIGNIHIH